MRRTAALALALAAGGLLLSGCGGSSSPASSGTSTPPGAEVHLAFTLFQERDVAIKAGESLTFINNNPIEHVIVGGPWGGVGADGLRSSEKDDGTYRLTLKDKGDTASQEFPVAGTFQFFCTIHKGMNGTVTVT